MPIISSHARKRKISGPAIAPYSDDVLATLLYTGNSGSQILNTQLRGFNLGGMFWGRWRSGTPGNSSHNMWDTYRGAAGGRIGTNSAAGADGSAITSFNDDGVSLNANFTNTSATTYAGWFMKVAKSFFTYTAWTGDGAPSRVIPHDLSQLPGLILVKALNGATTWSVWHRSATGDLDTTTSAGQTASKSYITAASISDFTVGNSVIVNGASILFEAFIFAHDVSVNGIIVSDKFTTDASGNATVNCGWPIQWGMVKSLGVGSWNMFDAARGPSCLLQAETATAEITASTLFSFTALGFNVSGATANTTYIFTAIRAPNKPGNPNTVTIPGGTSIDLRAQAVSNGWDQSSALTVNITGDVGSSSTGLGAINIAGTFPLGVTVNIAPGVMVAGRGGLGGGGAQAGNAGGPAFTVTTNNPVYINNNGTVAGGGGGGGGYYSGGPFGGNGAGLPILAPGGSSTTATRTNGGNGQASGYGPGGVGGVAGSAGSTAPTNGGAGGGGGLGGNGGTSSSRGPGFTYSDPGGNGQAGPGTTDSDATAYGHPTYPGGAAGAYATGNSKISWLIPGTRYGAAVA